MTKKVDQVPVLGHYLPHRAVDWDGMVADPRTGELVKEPSMTKQSFKDECDINNIVKRFEATGIVDHLNLKAAEGVYQDLPDPIDLQGALDVSRHASEAFAALPAVLRAHFDNDPVKFLDAVAYPTEATQNLFIEHGLATHLKPPAKAPEPVPVPASPDGPPKA